jgi:hypothetical protein
MREYGKMAGIASAGAFLLSLAVGLVSRNPFGVALARALLFAVLFAGLAAGARYLLAKYLPELVMSASPPVDGASGQTIDITLPEERPAPSRRVDESASLSGEAELAEEPDAELTDISGGPLHSAAGEPAIERERTLTQDDLLGNELEDILPPLTDEESAAGADGGAESVEEAESVTEESPSEGAVEAQARAEADPDLGRLPEIASIGEPPRGERPRRRASTPEGEMKGALGNRDPATLARAIRTVLKREEKG